MENGENKTLLVARLVAFTFYNEDINNHKLTVNHIDGNRLNNNLENLELISLKDNIIHAFNNDLMPCKKTKIINKHNNEEIIFRSMVQASKFIGKNKGYISLKIKRGQNENKDYKWEIM